MTFKYWNRGPTDWEGIAFQPFPLEKLQAVSMVDGGDYRLVQGMQKQQMQWICHALEAQGDG
eukprot:183975-Pelagomonas_calceolata.AAC.2